jgi:hypothetical protein
MYSVSSYLFDVLFEAEQAKRYFFCLVSHNVNAVQKEVLPLSPK